MSTAAHFITGLGHALLTLAVLVGSVQLATGDDVARFGAKDRRELQRRVEAQEELLARRAEGALASFYRQQWKIVEKLTPRVDNWHVDAICDHLQATVAPPGERPGINKLVINVPPRNSKSSTTCVAFPAWVWGPRNLPGKRFIFVTFRLSLARRDSRYTRNVISSSWYREYWGDRYHLLSDQRTKDRYDNNHTGYRMIGSFRGGVMGEGANYLVIDDPLDATKVTSPNELDHVIEVWKQGLVTRLNDQENDVRIIIMQRLHENDLCGHVLKEDGWEHLRLPAAFELEERCRTFVYVRKEPDNNAIVIREGEAAAPGALVSAAANVGDSRGTDTSEPAATSTPLIEGNGQTRKSEHGQVSIDTEARSNNVLTGKRLFFEDPRTEEDEPLNPKRFPPSVLATMKAEDEWVYAAQQQQRPAPRGGQIFKEVYWQYYDELPQDVDADGRATPKSPDHAALSFDLAFKDTKTSDYVGAMAAHLYGVNIYILPEGYEMKRLGFAGACDLIEQWTSRYPTISAKLVEDAANGPAVVEHLHQVVDGLVLVKPDGGKIARAFAAEPTVKSHHVFLPNPIDPKTGIKIPERAWVEQWKKNAAVFPKGKNDDDVDAFTQLVNYLKGTHSAMLDYMKQLKARDAARANSDREANEARRG